MILSFFQHEDGMSFFDNQLNIIHLHLLFAIFFLLLYTIKSVLFLSGNQHAYLSFKKKTLIIETLFAVGFLISGFALAYMLIGFGAWQHWLDPKITLALIAIPLGIVGFKKSNKILVALSLLFFYISLVIGLMHYH